MFDALFKTTGDLIALGGPVVAVLIGLSIVSLALILLKFFQFAYLRVGSHRRSARAAELWAAGRWDDARGSITRDRASPAVVLSVIMGLIAERIVPAQIIEEEAGRVATLRLVSLQRGFRALEAIAQIAPLLGLFGTVLGMIEAFQTLQSAGNAVDPSVLAGGIWVALLTTAAGLALAMPVSLILTWLESRVESERVVIESLSTKLLFEQQVRTLRSDRRSMQQVVSFNERAGHAH